MLIGKAIGPPIASSLIAKALEKTAGQLWGLRRSDLEKSIAEASETAYRDFVAAFPKGKALSDTGILKKFFDSITLKEELEKIVLTDHGVPNVNTLYAAFQKAGYTDDMLPGLDFKAAMNAFAGKFSEELADVIEHRRNEENAHLNLYLQQVEEHCGRLDFVGIPELKDKQDLRLDDIFITLRARGQVPEADVIREEELEPEDAEDIDPRRRAREEVRMREAAPIKLNEALKDNRKLVILGGPGAGKTTMLRYVALTLAQEEAEEKLGLPDGLVPIFVELSRFADRDDQQQPLGDFIYDYAKSMLNVSPPANFFEAFLEQGKCIVLLDGLDEVATLAQRVDVKNVVSSFASRYSGNTFVVTSRIAGYNEAGLGGDFAHFTVCDFTEDDVQQFAQKWYEAREGDTEAARTKAGDLVKAIKDNPRVAALARNPLMLTIIALIHRVEAELPNQRIKLYDKCTESLLYTWEAVKKRGEKPMSEEDKRKRLGWIAYWMQDIPGSGERERTVRRGQLQRRLAEILVEKDEVPNMGAAEAEAKLFLDQIRRRTGVLIERGLEIYSFVHLTFHEYFAACEVHRRFLDAAVTIGIDGFWDQELKPRLHDPRWQEVVLLFLGKLSGESSKAASEMVSRILNAGSRYEEILHRDLLLAGQCLADDVAVDRPLKKLILDRTFDLLWSGKYSGLRSRAGEILTAMRGSRYEDEIMQAFIKALGSEYRDVRSSAAEGLGNLGTASQDVIDALMKALGDEDREVRYRAAYALGDVGTASSGVIDALIKALGDEDREVRSSAAEALGNLGAASADVIDVLIKALRNQDSGVRARYSAAEALGNLGLASSDVIDVLIKALDDESGVVRSSAVEALGNLGLASSDVIDALIKALDDRSGFVRSGAAGTLGNLRPASADIDITDTLFKALSDANWRVRYSAAEAFGKLGAASSNIIYTLIEALRDKHSYVRSSAVEALGKLATASSDVIYALIGALGNADSYVRSGAASALGEVRIASGNVIDALMKALRDRSRYVRSSVALALGKLPGVPMNAICALIKVLGDDEYWRARSSVAEALGKLGTVSSDVIDALIKALGDEDRHVRYRSAEALGRLGTASSDVIDALIKALGDEEWNVRSRAAEALGRLGGGSAEVMEALLERLDSERDSSAANAIFEAISTLAAAEAAGDE